MWRYIITAVQFLTILPLRKEVKSENLPKSVFFFPLVGLLIGGILCLVYWVSAKIFPPMVASALTLLVWVILTGALHLDGLADTLDGLYAGKTKEERLNIMRDVKIGVMGIAGIVIILLLKFAFLSSISKEVIWMSLLLTPALSRWAMMAAGNLSPYARQEGKAKFFGEGCKCSYLTIHAIILSALSILSFGWTGLSLIAAVLALTLLSSWFLKKRLGGITGDTLGALNELSEVLVLLVICAIT